MTPCAPGATPAGLATTPSARPSSFLQQLQAGKSVEPTQPEPAATAHNWLPINFYDAREGEPRDTRTGGTAASCSPIGVMNSVELDVGNLWLWLQGAAPYAAGTGKNVNATKDNGYILYFSDRRGMQPDPNPTGNGLYQPYDRHVRPGRYGQRCLRVLVYRTARWNRRVYYTYSPEDVNADNVLDTWGQKYLGAGFGIAGGHDGSALLHSGNNRRHRRLLDDSAVEHGHRTTSRASPGRRWHGRRGNSYLPHPIAPATSGNGFTVASEEPVYVYGDYNSGAADPFFPRGHNDTLRTLPRPSLPTPSLCSPIRLLAHRSPTANVGWTDLESLSFPAT